VLDDKEYNSIRIKEIVRDVMSKVRGDLLLDKNDFLDLLVIFHSACNTHTWAEIEKVLEEALDE